MTDQEIRLLWLYAGELWPSWRLPTDADLKDIRLQAWRDQLGDLEGRHVRAAIVALGDHEFFPPLGTIRAKAQDLVRLGNGERPTPDVDEAWAEVTAAFHAVGSYGSPAWSHPAVAATVRAIGWLDMCASTNAEVLRGQFARLYATCRDRHLRESVAPPPAVAEILAQARAAIGHVGELEPSA